MGNYNVKEKNAGWKGGPVERICQTCGITFLAIRAKVPGNSYSDRTRSKSKYCSRECFAKNNIKNKIEKECNVCGIKMYVIPAKAEKTKFCSLKCKHNSMRSKITKSCIYCGKDFEVKKSRKEIAKYCSVECGYAGSKFEMPQKQCENCGREMTARNITSLIEKRFCSRECDSERRIKSPEHHKSIQRKHDRLRRARKNAAEGYFTEEEWSLLKRQYHHRCPSCGRSEPEIKLTIDHIVPLSKGGTNWIWNIQPLCGSCNSKKSNRNIIKYDYMENDILKRR